jgi:hypothetical protein
MIMKQHNAFWISGTAVPGPPYTDYWTPGGAILFQRDNGSVVELVRFNLQSFELEDQGVAALFGVELARLPHRKRVFAEFSSSAFAPLPLRVDRIGRNYF